MNNPSKFFDRAGIVPCAILSLTVLNLCLGSKNFAAPGIYTSMFGLLTVILYAFDVERYDILFILWALVQVVVLKHSASAKTVFSAADVWDPSQGIRALFYFPMVFGNGVQAGINLVGVFLLGLTVVFRPKAVMGNYLTFTAYRHNNSMGIVFPLKGMPERWVTLSGENDWLLVNMLQPFNYNNKAIKHVLIRRNDKQPLVKDQSNQLVFFKPVPDVNSISDKGNNKLDFADEEWALCK